MPAVPTEVGPVLPVWGFGDGVGTDKGPLDGDGAGMRDEDEGEGLG